MALVKCENCGAEISDKAMTCPKCGNDIKKRQDSPKICPECGTILENTVQCNNCGYLLKKSLDYKGNMKKIITAAAVAAIVLVGIVLFITRDKSNEYILDACREIQKKITNTNSLSLEEIYISDEVGTDTTIDYVYRVYIEYKYTNAYDRRLEDTALYIIDDKGETYLIDDNSSEMQYAYKIIAEGEIYGIAGWFEPSDNWTELTGSEIRKIQAKID